MTKQWSIYYFFFKDFQDINKDEPNAVLVGLAPDQMNYEKLTTAFRLIKENKAPLIAINKSRYIQTKEGLSLGPGMKWTWIHCILECRLSKIENLNFYFEFGVF